MVYWHHKEGDMKPGDLVRRIVNPSLGLAVVIQVHGEEIEIITDKGEIKWVFYDALEAVDEL
jgi:hypothetical protein